jgi:hypothetical protein
VAWLPSRRMSSRPSETTRIASSDGRRDWFPRRLGGPAM